MRHTLTFFLLEPGSTAEAKGSLFFKQVDRAKVKTSGATLRLTGDPTRVQILEAAGADVGPQLPTDDNFGFGQLHVGGNGKLSVAAVLDRFDNGQRVLGHA